MTSQLTGRSGHPPLRRAHPFTETEDISTNTVRFLATQCVTKLCSAVWNGLQQRLTETSTQADHRTPTDAQLSVTGACNPATSNDG